MYRLVDFFFVLFNYKDRKKERHMKTKFAYTCFIIFVLFIKLLYIATAVYLLHMKRHVKKISGTTTGTAAATATTAPTTAKKYTYSDIVSGYFSSTSTPEETIDILMWVKERLDFLYVLLMSVFLIVFFSRLTPPEFYAEVVFERETKILLVFLGIILLLEAPWKTFIHESPWYRGILPL
jgi:hypothetical protein